MNDKELLVSSIATFAGATSKQLFGVSFGAPASALIKLGIDNMLKKEPYKFMLDFFFDEDGNLPSKSDFFDALADIVKQKPIQIWKIKLGDSDIREIEKIFNAK